MADRAFEARALQKVGERFRKERERQGVSLRQFSQQIGVSPSFYSKVERGEALAGIETYERIGESLGFEPQEILPQIGVIDSKTQELFRQLYRSNAVQLAGHLRTFKPKK